MNYVIVGRINPRSGQFSDAVANLSGQHFGPTLLKYERVLVSRDPLAADLVEPISRR
ncbi:hypothetical protein MI149_30065 (plasmid) [Mycolicibacterium crocinum]|jgi:hypothetical protein|uniref:DUF1330 domain-containing protein n=1 Tax=Mycolicibacterium crocinum TaxID=388459 RepID=A0ABY3TTD6_9MYCO|nr:hypothetical protein [Mycolicibacterium crocinum]ULN44742.1 hypothetical protein MI149_30065 [Mycolicibacterium crocinum]